jgi:hypothetical protein
MVAMEGSVLPRQRQSASLELSDVSACIRDSVALASIAVEQHAGLSGCQPNDHYHG